MTPSEFYKLLENVEQNWPVHEWQVDGVCIWHLVRIKLSEFIWMKATDGTVSVDASVSWRLKLRNRLRNIAFQIAIRFFGLRYVFSRKTSVLLFSLSHYRVEWNGKFYHRFFDPIIEKLKNEGVDFVSTEVSLGIRRRFPFGGFTPLFVEPQFRKMKSLRFFKISDLKAFPGFEDFCRSTLGDKAEAFQFSLADSIDFYLKAIKVWQGILSRFKPEVVLMNTYYSEYGLALCYAANELGVPSVDVQHGVLGPHHFGYNYCPKTTKEKNIFPSNFWVWSEQERRHVESTFKVGRFHGANLGNPWSWKWSDLTDKSKSSSQKVKILYTVQPFDLYLNGLPNELVTLIEKTKTSHEWLIRLHPNQLQQVDIFERQIRERGLTNVDSVTRASCGLLPELLCEVGLHITHSSSVVIEASKFGLNSIVVFKEAIPMYSELSSQGFVHYREMSMISDQDLVTLVKSPHYESNNVDLPIKEILKNFKFK